MYILYKRARNRTTELTADKVYFLILYWHDTDPTHPESVTGWKQNQLWLTFYSYRRILIKWLQNSGSLWNINKIWIPKFLTHLYTYAYKIINI